MFHHRGRSFLMNPPVRAERRGSNSSEGKSKHARLKLKLLSPDDERRLFERHTPLLCHRLRLVQARYHLFQFPPQGVEISKPRGTGFQGAIDHREGLTGHGRQGIEIGIKPSRPLIRSHRAARSSHLVYFRRIWPAHGTGQAIPQEGYFSPGSKKLHIRPGDCHQGGDPPFAEVEEPASVAPPVRGEPQSRS